MSDTTAVTDLLFRPAAELAELVRGGELSARELTEASLVRIEAVDDRVNAFTHVDAEGALAAADAVGTGDERPFAGVPLAIKTESPVKDLPLSLGSELFGDFRPGHDSFIVRRLREAGFVIVGITSMPEMGIMPVTEPRRFGPTRNPWNLDRTPGGSSGGSAAAVAAGMVPVAHGADGGGSIRIPAACTGLVGLKASRNRVSLGPDQGDHWLVAHGALTRTVADSAALLDVLAGYEVGDANWAPPPDAPFAVAAAQEPRKLRVAVTTDPPVHASIDPTCAAAAQDAAELLASLGHDVEEATPTWHTHDTGAGQLFLATFGAHIAMGVLFGALVTQRAPSPELVEPLTWDIYTKAQELPSIGYIGAVIQLQVFARTVIGFFNEYDVVVTPTLAQRPVAIGEYDTSKDVEEWGRTGEFTPFTALANMTGLPAISLPLYHGDDGLPTGVQLFGPPAGEALLLSLGAQLEDAQPWAGRRPPLDGSP